MASFVLLLLLLLPLLSLFLFKARRRSKLSVNLPPSPPKLPIIGNLHQLGKLPHRSLHHLSQRHGPLMYLQLGHFPAVVASSSHTAREILKTHDLQCCSRPSLAATSKLSYGGSDISFAPYGDHWRELRKLCITELFTMKKVLSFQSVWMDEINRMVTFIAPHSAKSPINLSQALLSFSNNITCRTALGRSYDTSHVFEAQAMFSGFFFSDYFPFTWWLDKLTGMRARLEKNFLGLDSFYSRVIGEHLDPSRLRHESCEDAVDCLLRIQKESTSFTEDHVKGVLMDIFVAGTETVSSSVEWAMSELMRSPDALKKAQDEVRGFCGGKVKVEEADLQQLRYVKSVVKEAFRLHPPVPMLLSRVTLEDCRIDGYDIQAGTRVFINAWAIGRDPSCWERPEDFWPERFMDNSIDVKGHDFQLIPFGAGRRICPAVNSALLLVELALANLLFSFDWELPVGMKKDIDMDESPGVAVHRKSPLCLLPIKYAVLNSHNLELNRP